MARDRGAYSVSRRTFCWTLAGVLVTPGLAIAQTEKIRRIGILYLGKPNDPFVLANTGAFRQRLRELGYVDGKTIVIDERFAEGDATRLNELARELVASKVDILVTQAVAATVAARLATSTIPIVMLHAGNPVEAGLIESLARPGGNITGTSNISLGGKLVELLHEVVPRARRVAVLGNPTNAGLPPARRDAEEAARRIGVSVVFVAVTRNEDFPDVFATIRNARPDALLVVVEPLIATHRSEVVEFAAAARLPAVYDNGTTARIGGLISYAPDISEHYPLAAIYVDKILKGAKPADLPVQQATKFELVINLKTAKALGVSIPQALLVRADEVIQ
jgi:putative ABC transport system substrate-binding protein